jgi:hypothetical protein
LQVTQSTIPSIFTLHKYVTFSTKRVSWFEMWLNPLREMNERCSCSRVLFVFRASRRSLTGLLGVAMKFKTLVSAVAVSALTATQAFAATVIPTNGQVMVNQGSGFKEIKGPLEVKAGDTITVKPGSSASISYSSNCLVPVTAGQVATVAPKVPCVVQGSMEQTQANLPPSSPPVPLLGPIGPGLVVGGLVVGGVVAGVVAINNNSKSSSP